MQIITVICCAVRVLSEGRNYKLPVGFEITDSSVTQRHGTAHSTGQCNKLEGNATESERMRNRWRVSPETSLTRTYLPQETWFNFSRRCCIHETLSAWRSLFPSNFGRLQRKSLLGKSTSLIPLQLSLLLFPPKTNFTRGGTDRVVPCLSALTWSTPRDYRQSCADVCFPHRMSEEASALERRHECSRGNLERGYWRNFLVLPIKSCILFWSSTLTSLCHNLRS
jgi:hypothetical protein